MFDAFYSDPHFGHANVLGYSNRPFSSVEEHDEALIERYNETVGRQDVVLWLGDCFFTNIARAQEIMNRLNGLKFLVRGNHDGGSSRMARMGFTAVATEPLTMQIGERRVIACHYPYRMEPDAGGRFRHQDRCPPKLKGQVLLHGHTHSPRRRKDSMIHVGVDAWDYHPATIGEVMALVEEI